MVMVPCFPPGQSCCAMRFAFHRRLVSLLDMDGRMYMQPSAQAALGRGFDDYLILSSNSGYCYLRF